MLGGVLLFFLVAGSTLSGKCQTTYQAENYTSQNGVLTGTNQSGYTGSGFADYGGIGTWAEWNNVSASSAGAATINFRFANGGTATRNCTLLVNGVSAGTVSIGVTGSWTNWVTTANITINLNSGNNTIRLTASTSAGGPNVDKFDVSVSPPTTCGSATGGPTNNPISDKYGSGYPWAGSIKWGCVFNIMDYGGNANGTTDNINAFNSARDAAVSNGGGVVYFPAGTYYFSDDILLKNGVVIRGATPSNTDAKTSTYAPSSKLLFPKYNASLSGSGTANSTAFKKIRTTSPDTDSNIGLVYVDVNRAGIKLTGSLTATNRNIIVFGVRNNNVADPEPAVPTATYNGAPFQNAWQRWSARFAANILIQAYENVLVANNRVNDNITDNYQQSGYIVRNGATLMTFNGSEATFNYTNHYSIEINRGQGGDLNTPATGPSLFRDSVIIRDNWVYGTMRTKIHVAGQGLLIKDNVLRDEPGKVAWVDPTGTQLVGTSATLENRGIDWSGHAVLISGNDIEVVRHKMKNTTYSSVDGEGMLIQECCGGTTVRGVTITDNIVNSYIGIYKMRDIEDATITYNTLTNATGALSDLIYVSANTNGSPFYAKNVKIENNSLSGNISLLASGAGGGTGNFIRYNTTSAGKSIRHTCAANATISGNTGFTVQSCNSSSNVTAAPVTKQSLVSNDIIESPLVADVAIYPQPASEFINLDVSLENAEKIKIQLTTLLGESIMALSPSLHAGVSHLKIPVQSLKTGTYILRIDSDSLNSTKKVLIAH